MMFVPLSALATQNSVRLTGRSAPFCCAAFTLIEESKNRGESGDTILPVPETPETHVAHLGGHPVENVVEHGRRGTCVATPVVVATSVHLVSIAFPLAS
jgi:hypothetical protein